MRLQALRGADALDDLFRMPGRCHPLKGRYAGCHAMDLHQGWRLVFRIEVVPAGGDGSEVGAGLGKEDIALVIEIVDYHG
ncbi:hypothetical protein Sru01_50530 [Sphaerisporangium rufum]|uniref:Plasmid maintenance system killer protein n=1 Tax=Sphaerisporangium rufum TaxID=1381558 RepID=A0A919R7Y5_9ACTN|nr:hypothetical protein Sru01_50530 [Sphaerisporangium rufum]